MEIRKRAAAIAPNSSGPPQTEAFAVAADPSFRDLRRAMKRWPPPAVSAEIGRFTLGAFVVALVVVGALFSGIVEGSNATLQLMGFDPDRSQLVTALSVGAIAAAASTIATGRIGGATLLGVLSVAALFSGTFVAETRSAMSSIGPAGSFDTGGWIITLLTLVTSGLVAAWAGAALASTARPALADACRMFGWIVGRLFTLAARLPFPRLARARIGLWARLALASNRSGRRLGRRPGPLQRRVVFRAGVVGVFAVVLLVAIPVFGDLVNYSPDSHMLHGGRSLQGFEGPASIPTQRSVPLPIPSLAVAPDSPQASNPPPNSAYPRPWLSWRSSGGGHVVAYQLPAPWQNGKSSQVEVTVYTPAGYHSNGTLKYPTLYEVPWNFATWDKAVAFTITLDALIEAGTIPPTIVVSVDAGVGPYPDSECANSYDGLEWYDQFVAQTVVPWVDAHYRTIVAPAARAIMGMSQGGYCAAILALHHPDVFGTSISFSGYFYAGAAGPNSARPFGFDPQAIKAASPDVVVGQLRPAVRAGLYFIVVAQPSQALYGQQANEFNLLLTANGYPHLAIAATEPHGWVQVRQELAPALEAWAARLVVTPVF